YSDRAIGMARAWRDEVASAKSMIDSISQHIGNAKTRCLLCKLIFASATEYYEHLLTYYHLCKVYSSESPVDFLTMVVNVQER
ncbi:hypothetical protein PMAYCL1PPCAC_00464, partial [Pristionchus mayeri]